MPLYVRGSDVRIVGTLKNVPMVAAASGLNDEAETVFRNDKPVWISEDGGEYATNAIEDRRDDGSVVQFAPMIAEPVRPLTSQILARWRHDVMHFQTQLSAKEWSDSLTVEEWLATHGLVLAKRDPLLNPESEGRLQISGRYEALHRCQRYTRPPGLGRHWRR